MDEDIWLSIEDDSSHRASDSDAIDSETEAELYSTIHYEQNINFQISDHGIFENNELNHNSSPAIFLSPRKNNICTLKKPRTSNEENKISPDKNVPLNNRGKDSYPNKKFKRDLKGKPSNYDYENESSQSFKHESEGKIENSAQCRSSIIESPKTCDSFTAYESTDSDNSDIWKGVNPLEESDFTTNLSREKADIVYLTSSDSDSELPSTNSHTFLRRESVLKNLSMPNIKMGERHEGQWHINDEDLYRSRKNLRRRYHDTIELTCTNCNRKGHNFRTCQEPKVLKCFICGGPHLGSKCPNRICGICLRYGHARKHCQMRLNFFFCELCSRYGHTIQYCPDIWRRYHLTTEPLQIVRGTNVKQKGNVYCWNCGQNGHFGGVCQKSLPTNSVNTWPCVISYDNPGKIFRDIRLFQERNLVNFRNGQLFNFNEQVQNGESSQTVKPPCQKSGKRKNRKNANQRRQERKKILKMKNPDREMIACKKAIKNSEKKIALLKRTKDFPRSRKKFVPKQCDDELPMYLEAIRKKKLKQARLKLKRQLKRQEKIMGQISVKVENN